MPDSDDTYHAGEIAVQERAGVRAVAARLGPHMIQPAIDADFAAFLAAQPFVIVASHTPDGQVWASVLTGLPGFATAPAPDQVVIRAVIAPGDPLADALADGPAQIGMLVLQPVSRGRIRINGIARQTADGLELTPREVFGNCPKYIQRRLPTELAGDGDAPRPATGGVLNPEQGAFIHAADTFFIASRHPDRGADASHRGGRPGFVSVAPDGSSLTFPDYQGNNMFQTLGNLTANPRAGLLFIDWETGRTLQLSGRAQVVWDETRIAAWPGARRLIDVELEAVVDQPAGSALRWRFVEAARNPPVPAES